MFSLAAELSSLEPTCAVDVAVDAVDLDALLVDWLNELLFLAEERGVVFTEFEVRGSAGEDGAYVRATVRGSEPADPPKQIKAATFGGLKVSRTAEGFEAEIVFDV
jgi:SHS2 domain-containing protein